MSKKILTLDNVPVINKKIGKIDTIEKLKASTIYSLGDVVEVLGFHAKGDGSHHKRVAKDKGDGSGEQGQGGIWWCIVHNGEVNVSWFGAKGDGVTDDSLCVNKAFEFSNRVIIDKKIFSKTPIYKKNTQTLIFDGGTIVVPKDFTGKSVIYVKNDGGQYHSPNGIYGARIYAEFSYGKDKHATQGTLADYPNTIGIYMELHRKYVVDDCVIVGMRNNGIYSETGYELFISKTEIWGMSLTNPEEAYRTNLNKKLADKNSDGLHYYNCGIDFNLTTDSHMTDVVVVGYHIGARCHNVNAVSVHVWEYSNKMHFGFVISSANNKFTNCFADIVSESKETDALSAGFYELSSVDTSVGSTQLISSSSQYTSCNVIGKVEASQNVYGFVCGENSNANRSLHNNYVNCVVANIKRGNFVFNRNLTNSNKISIFNCSDIYDRVNKSILGATFLNGSSNLSFLNSSNKTMAEFKVYENSIVENGSYTTLNTNFLEVAGKTLLKTATLSGKTQPFINLSPVMLGNVSDSTSITDGLTPFYEEGSIRNGFVCSRGGLTWALYKDGAKVKYYISGKEYELQVVSLALSLDTPYYTLKMQQEDIYEEYVAYRDELHEYENSQTGDETMLLPVLQEPDIPESVRTFAEKYKLI